MYCHAQTLSKVVSTPHLKRGLARYDVPISKDLLSVDHFLAELSVSGGLLVPFILSGYFDLTSTEILIR